jgi:ribonucleoside-diphosphate reductase alpha chain
MTEKYKWLNKDSRDFLSRGVLLDGISPESRIRQILDKVEEYSGIKGFADETEEYVAEGCYSFSTPVWTNFGLQRGLPVSCFGSYIPDDTAKIFSKVSEVAMMSKFAGGTSGYFGDLRKRGSEVKGTSGNTEGPVRFMELFDKTADIISQGSARRGAFAAYLPVEHPDIEEFLQIRAVGNPIQNMSFGVTISDQWMKEMEEGDSAKRKIWGSIIRKRFESGYPYIFFTDTVNNNKPKVYKDKGLDIKASNLCSEICLSSDEDNSFVCVLMSLNLLHWDKIKANPNIIKNAIIILDCVCEEFIQRSANLKHMESAHNFAKQQRALGLGGLGWHSLLQSKMIPFESIEAKMLNNQIWKTIRSVADETTKYLAELLGEPELLKGYGRRNATTLAIAPTVSSSFILGQVSQSIEPENSCYYIKKTAKGSFTYQNPYLKELLIKYNKDIDEVWQSILVHGGSVQHLDFLSELEKSVFKTFGEISQKEIVIQASQRQKFIDQSQSLNLMIPLKTEAKQVSQLLIEGWKIGVKTFYYQRNASPSQKLLRDILSCTSCEA